MKTKLVLWGTNAQDERVLIALELLAEENKVNIYTFPEEVATENFSEQLMNVWRDGGEVPFPENFSKIETELSVSESLLPEDLKVERGDLIHRAQTEWHFVVLSSKLHDAYESELDELRDRMSKFEKFDQQTWDELKSFWNKVQGQVREKNLFREHANLLRDHTNELFARMKELRNKLDEEFHKHSKGNLDTFMNSLEAIEKKISDGLRLQAIFEDLKGIQRKFRDAKLTRDHRSKIWERLDAAFKTVKEKRFGSSGDSRSPVDRLKRRYDGLISAIQKMERSINRDREDLHFQDRKIATTDGQLEAQIRKAKILMIEERIRSKEEKLNEMRNTQKELERRLEIQKAKEAKRLEREHLEKAKREAQQKIAEEIKQAAASRKEEAAKLEKAAEAIVHPDADSTADTTEQPPQAEEPAQETPEQEPQMAPATENIAEPQAQDEPAEQPAPPAEEKQEKHDDGLIEAIGATVGEALEDLSDTVKAVAKVVGDQIEEAVEDLKEEFTGKDNDDSPDKGSAENTQEKTEEE